MRCFFSSRRTASRAWLWFCSKISTPSSPPEPSTGKKLAPCVTKLVLSGVIVLIFVFPPINHSKSVSSRCGTSGRTSPHTATTPFRCRLSPTRVPACGWGSVRFTPHRTTASLCEIHRQNRFKCAKLKALKLSPGSRRLLWACSGLHEVQRLLQLHRWQHLHVQRQRGQDLSR